MKVPPLIINLKDIEKHKKNKKHKKSKKHHHKHHHDHHHHNHHHSNDNDQNNETQPREEQLQQSEVQQQQTEVQQQQPKQLQQLQKIFPPVLEPMDNPDREPTPPPLYMQQQELDVKLGVTPLHEQQQPKQSKPSPVHEETQPPSVHEPSVTPVVAEPSEPTPPPLTHVELAPAVVNKLACLEKADDGNVRLKIITPMQDAPSQDRILDLDQLQPGMDILPPHLEEDQSVHPVDPVEPLAFGSFLPLKDSTNANLSEEESEALYSSLTDLAKQNSDALLEIYGGNMTCLEYAESLRNFARGTGYALNMTDSLLNHLTDGKHKEVSSIQTQLDEVDALLEDLKTLQHRRLSSSPSPIKPEDKEVSLAEEVSSKITKLIKERMKPGELCDSAAIFKALGLDDPKALLRAVRDKEAVVEPATEKPAIEQT